MSEQAPLLLVVKTEEGATNREHGRLRKLENAGKQSPRVSRRNAALLNLDCRTSDLQNHKLINLCCVNRRVGRKLQCS